MMINYSKLLEIKHAIKNRFRNRFLRAYPFGSEEKGSAKDSSDIDLLIVLDKVEFLSRDLEDLITCTYGIQLTLDRPLHLTPADEESFNNGKCSLYRVVARDGVEV